MQTTQWMQRIDDTTKGFITSFGHLSAAELNFKPNAETWSIAQNIDHLTVINSSYFPVIAALRAGNYQLPFMAKLGFMVNFLGNMVLGAVQPDRKKKMKTFPIWEPSQSELSGDILTRFEKHQNDLKQLIESCSDLLDRGIIISSPANKNIVYKLETAFDIITIHEQRHLAQAREVLAVMPKTQAAK